MHQEIHYYSSLQELFYVVQGLELDSNCVLALNLKGLALHNSGLIDQAYQIYKRAHQLDQCKWDFKYGNIFYRKNNYLAKTLT